MAVLELNCTQPRFWSKWTNLLVASHLYFTGRSKSSKCLSLWLFSLCCPGCLYGLWCCWLTMHVLRMTYWICWQVTSSLSPIGWPFTHWLASNSSVNPFIYGYYNKNFKQGFQATLKHRPSCCLDRPSKVHLRRVKKGKKKSCCHLDKILRPNALNLGVRNKIYTDNDPTGCVCLEMEHRPVSKKMRGSGAEGGNREPVIKRKLLEDTVKISSTGPTVNQAWEL